MGRGADMEGSGQMLSAGQGTGAADFAGQKLPTGQAVGAREPAAQKEPAGQSIVVTKEDPA